MDSDMTAQLYIRQSMSHDTYKALKESLLTSLMQGRIGLEETVDNLYAALQHIAVYCYFHEPLSHPYNVKRFVEKAFHQDVKSLLLAKLVQYNNPTGDQSILVKALDVIEKFQKMVIEINAFNRRRIRKRKDIRRQDVSKIIMGFTEHDISLLMDLWTSATDEKVVNCFVKVFGLMWVMNENMYLSTTCNIYIKSPARMKGYVPLQFVLPINHGFNVFGRVIREEPTFLSTLVKSAACLVNCWRSLHAADMICERQWIEGLMKIWMQVIFNHLSWIAIVHDSNTVKGELLLKKEVGRFLRCVAFAIVQISHDATALVVLRKFMWTYISHIESPMARNAIYGGPICCYFFFALFSKREVSEFLAKCDEESIVKRTLHFILECELQPLSRKDTNIFAFPEHVKDALESLPDSDLLFEPEVGCCTLLRANRHRLSAIEWMRCIFEKLDFYQRAWTLDFWNDRNLAIVY